MMGQVQRKRQSCSDDHLVTAKMLKRFGSVFFEPVGSTDEVPEKENAWKAVAVRALGAA